MGNLYRATFFYFVGSILTRFSGFILIPLYTNILSTTEYGSYGLLMAIYAILNVLYQAGLFQGFTKFFCDTGSDKKRVFSTTFNTILLFGFIVALLLTVLLRPLSSLFSFDNGFSSLLLILIWLILLDTLAYIGLHFLRTKQQARKAVTYSLITAFANLSLNVLFLAVLKLGVMGILIAQGISNILLFLLCLRHFKQYYYPLIDWSFLRKLIRFSYPLIIAGFFAILMDVADRFFIDYYLDRSQVGIYSLAYKLGLIMNVLVIAFRTAYIPHFLSKEGRTDLIPELRRTLLKLISLMAVLYVAIVPFLKYLFRIELFGFSLINPEFGEASLVAPFILLAYSFNGLAAFFSIAPYRTGKSHHFLITDLIGFSVNLLINILLIPRLGIIGAALATLVGYYAATLFIFFLFCREFRQPLFDKRSVVVIAGGLVSLYASLVTGVLLLRLLLLILFVFYCLRINKTSLRSFFRLTGE